MVKRGLVGTLSVGDAFCGMEFFLASFLNSLSKIPSVLLGWAWENSLEKASIVVHMGY